MWGCGDVGMWGSYCGDIRLFLFYDGFTLRPISLKHFLNTLLLHSTMLSIAEALLGTCEGYTTHVELPFMCAIRLRTRIFSLM
jgi:hypothetical protein